MLRRHTRSIAGLAAAVAAIALTASPARAAWGPVLQPAASANGARITLSVDGRGDVGAAWLQERGRKRHPAREREGRPPTHGGPHAAPDPRPHDRRPHHGARQ